MVACHIENWYLLLEAIYTCSCILVGSTFMQALTIVTHVLRVGGKFIAKIFRGKDTSLLYCQVRYLSCLIKSVIWWFGYCFWDLMIAMDYNYKRILLDARVYGLYFVCCGTSHFPLFQAFLGCFLLEIFVLWGFRMHKNTGRDTSLWFRLFFFLIAQFWR